MRISKRHKIIIWVSALILAIMTLASYGWSRQSVAQLQRRQESRMSPVIMIPGSSASVNRFDTLVARINQMDKRNHSLLKVGTVPCQVYTLNNKN